MEDKLHQASDTDLLNSSTTSPSDADLPANVPAKKLMMLMNASDEMMQSIFRRDRKATLNTVVRHVHDLLEAEACAIFLVPEDSPEELVLGAEYTDKRGHDFDPVRRPIRSEPQGGFIGHIAHVGEIVSLNSTEIETDPYIADKNAPYLISERCFSTLVIPLKDRKGRVLGVLKADNKKGSNGEPNEAIFFDSVDASLTRILANKIVIVLENLRMFETLRGLMQAMHTARDLDEILSIILNEGLALLHADRGDLALWGEGEHELIMQAAVGESTLEIGQIVPNSGIVHTVWNTQNPILCRDVSSEPDYFEVDSRTQNEIAVLVEFEGRAIGVLNAESFELNGFDEQDLEVLQLLAQYATIAVQVVGKETRLHGIVRRLGEYSPSQEVLTSILESVRDIYGFDAGIIYIADDTNRLLCCSAFIGCGEGLRINPMEFSYRFNEMALATEVLRKKTGYFSLDPSKDPIVNSRGVQTFQIHSPLVAVPLIFGEKAVGTLMVWSRHNPPPTKEDIERLEPFARLAAANIAISESERKRTVVLEGIQYILGQMQKEQSADKHLRLILYGVLEAGFDRVRAFKFDDESQNFVGLDSVGMEDLTAFDGYKTPLDQNPYAKHIAETALSNPNARRYDHAMFGSDPDALPLGKSTDLPWAVVPLVISGRLYGQIVADNAHTRREITNDSLEYMTLLGALAAQAIANAETIEMEREQMKVEARSDLARRIIHDLKTPAMTTQIFLKRLIEGLQTLPSVPPEVFGWAETVSRQVGRISALAEGIQRLRHSELRKRDVNINELVQRAIRDSLTTDDCEVAFDLCKPDPILAVDVDDIDEAITQLAANAWQVMKDKGKLVVKTSISSAARYLRLSGESDRKSVLISLTDSGPGVQHSIRQNIFNAGVSITGGTGLGLYFVRIIAEEHGGAAWLEDTGSNGSTFIIALPSEVMEEN